MTSEQRKHIDEAHDLLSKVHDELAEELVKVHRPHGKKDVRWGIALEVGGLSAVIKALETV